MTLYDLSEVSDDLQIGTGKRRLQHQGKRFLIGGKTGARAYAALKTQLYTVAEGYPLVVRFPLFQLVDVAFLEESVVRLGKEIMTKKRVARGEAVRFQHGERCLLLEGLEPDATRNLRAVLGWRYPKLAFLSVDLAGSSVVIGEVGKVLLDTLDLVQRQGYMTIAQLVKKRNIETRTASSRLRRLYDLRLLRRDHKVTAQGLVYTYYYWQWIA